MHLFVTLHLPLVITLLHLVTGINCSIEFGFGTVSQSTTLILEFSLSVSIAQLGSVSDLHW